MSVNVEEIMSGIRAEIQEKGYSSDMLSFADVPADADAGIYVERFDADMLRGNVQYISEHHRVDPYRPLAGNPVAVFFKKVLRKFMSFYVEPYAAEQSSLNANIAQAEQQVELYIRESRMHSTKELLDKVEALELQQKNTKIAMEQMDEYPDIVIGCAGGGSNLGGLIAPFMQDKLTGKSDPRIFAVEPASCPSLTRGVYKYDFCDTGKITPMAKMYTLGCTFKPSANHAGGLRYHGMSPILSKLYADKYMEAESYEQTKVFEAAVQFAKLETILPAPESAHAIRGAIDEALKCKETGETKTILFGLTGTGYFDMTAYAAYNEGRMSDSVPTDEELQPSIDALPTIPGIQE